MNKHREKVISLLNRSQLICKTGSILPPEEASASLGTQIANSFVQGISFLLEQYVSNQIVDRNGCSSNINGKDKTKSKFEELQCRQVKEWNSIGEQVIDTLCLRNNNYETHSNGQGWACVNSALVHSFFSTLARESLKVIFDISSKEEGIYVNEIVDGNIDIMAWWVGFVVQCEQCIIDSQNGKKNHFHHRTVVLSAVVKAFSEFSYGFYYLNHYVNRRCQENENDGIENWNMTAELYQRCSLTTTRQSVIRECVHIAFTNYQSLDQNLYASIKPEEAPVHGFLVAYLSPLLSIAVISAPLISQSIEVKVILDCVLRECRNLLTVDLNKSKIKIKNKMNMLELVPWLTQLLDSFLLASISQSNDECVCTALRIGYDFLLSMIDFISSLLSEVIEKRNTVPGVTTFFNIFCTNIIPIYTTTSICYGLYDLSLHPILIRLKTLFCSIRTKHLITLEISSDALYQISVMSLLMADEANVKLALELVWEMVHPFCDKKKNYLSGSIVWGVMNSLGCIFSATLTCEKISKSLLSCAISGMKTLNHAKNIDETTSTHIFDLFSDSYDINERLKLIKIFTRDINNANVNDKEIQESNLTQRDQCQSLLLGLSLLTSCINDNETYIDAIFENLAGILRKFPHLSVRSLPSLMLFIDNAISNNKSKHVLSAFEFVSLTISRDVTCAHAVWSLLSEMLSPETPINIQVMIVRLYPLLCQSNKRLYGRVCESLRFYVTHPNVELRIASSITIYDITKEDLVQDVTDVIGWIQLFLQDKDSIVIHYAILSLNNLVQVGDLDYSIIIKVLNKKLVNLNDVSKVLELEDVVIEALVALLGNGDIKEKNDSEVMKGVNASIVNISPQIQVSILCLLELGLSSYLSLDANSDSSFILNASKCAILTNIYKSLTKYSISSLGLDNEMIRNAHGNKTYTSIDSTPKDEEQSRYSMLKKIAFSGLMCPINDDNFTESIINFNSKIVQFEQLSLGALLWKTHIQSVSSSTLRKIPLPKPYVKFLPTYEDIRKRHETNPSLFSAVSIFFCYKGHSENDVTELFSEILEIANDMLDEPSDPVFKAIYIQSWTLVMQKVWEMIDNSSDGEKEGIIREIMKQINESHDEDTAKIFFAAFSLSLPDTSFGSEYIEFSQNLIKDGFDSNKFEKKSSACISLGLVAMKNIEMLSLGGVDSIISSLEFVLTESRKVCNVCFEAAFSLALIANAMSSTTSLSKTNGFLNQIRTILSILLKEIGNCLENPNSAVISFFSLGFEPENIAVDLVQFCNSLNKSDLKINDSHKYTMKCLCVAFSHAAPAMVHLDPFYVYATYNILTKMPWGFGKGYMLSSMHKTCEMLGILKNNDLNELTKECIKTLEETSTCGTGEDDVLFVLIQITSGKEWDLAYEWCQRILQDTNKNFRLDVRVSAIVASCKLIGTLSSVCGCDGNLSSYPQLTSILPKVKLRKIIETLYNLADNINESRKVRDAASMSLGILSAMKYSGSSSDDNFLHPSLVGCEKAEASSPQQGRMTLNLSNSILFAREESLVSTLVKAVTDLMIKCDRTNVIRSRNVLSCLNGILLPGQFAKVFEKIIRFEGIEDSHVKDICVKSLCEQAGSLQHRSTSDRQEFVRITIVLAKQAPQAFFSVLGSASVLFMKSLFKVIPWWTSKAVEETLIFLLSICRWEMKMKNSLQCTSSLLTVFQILLEQPVEGKGISFHSLAPATLSSIKKCLIKEFFPFLCPSNSLTNKNNGGFSLVWTQFLSCLTYFSLEILDSHNFFSFHGVENDISDACNILRAHSISFLNEQGRLGAQRGYHEISKAQLWVTRQWVALYERRKLSSSQIVNTWFVALNLARAGSKLPSEFRKKLISAMLEIMVQESNNSLCFEVLATQIVMWLLANSQREKNSISSSLFLLKQTFCLNQISSQQTSILLKILLKELPPQLGIISHDLGISSFVMNRSFHATVSYLSQNKFPYGDSEALACLKGIITCCKTHKNCKHHASIMASILLSN